MPWKVCKPMDERLKFVARVLEGEQMAGLCREFGISRKTGYKLVDRYNDSGLEAHTCNRAAPTRQSWAEFAPQQQSALSLCPDCRASVLP